MKAILILMDTLNRHMLKAYNPKAEAITPNIDRLAGKSFVFDNHFIGSAPCMPARRDIQTGRLNFLERGWGPIEPWDCTLPALLKKRGIFSHIVTDHCHYAEVGGEGYMQQYDTWELIRGQETDTWASQIKEPPYPQKYLGTVTRQYQCNRSCFKTDADFPTPKTFAAAVQWLQKNEGCEDFFLTVETFDPHEPFDSTGEFQAMYPDSFKCHYNWPRYSALNAEETPEAILHLRNQYYAALSMADKWLGKLLDEFDRQNLWEDTLIIFTSDHGHMLGEHSVTGKNRYHAWNEMARIPLFIHTPGMAQGNVRKTCLTQNIDLFPTVLELSGQTDFGETTRKIHGKSLWPVLCGKARGVRDYAIYGWFGMPVNITDGTYTYFRAAVKGNSPLYAYMGIPVSYHTYLGYGMGEENFSAGRFLGDIDMPLYRMKVATKQDDVYLDIGESKLYNIRKDPGQLYPIKDKVLEKKICHALICKLKEHEAPEEQYDRLGLKK